MLASDCQDLFAFRDDELYAARGGAGPLALLASLGEAPLDVAADERFLHLAVSGKGGGLFRVAKNGKGLERLIEGDVWRLAVDDEGVYWGEHAKGWLSGNLFMLQK